MPFVEITSIEPNKHHVVGAAGLSVSGEATPGTTIWVKVLRLDDSVLVEPSIGGGWQNSVATNGHFTVANVNGVVPKMLIGNNDNKAVAILQDGGVFSSLDVVSFRARPNPESLDVPAKSCLWFAFAPGGIPGPGDVGDTEPDTAQHRPPSFAVPVNVTKCSIMAEGNWDHGGAESTAAGKDPIVGLQNPGYRSDIYQSGQISIMEFQVNTLIGMWVDIDQVPIGNPFKVGAGPIEL